MKETVREKDSFDLSVLSHFVSSVLFNFNPINASQFSCRRHLEPLSTVHI